MTQLSNPTHVTEPTHSLENLYKSSKFSTLIQQFDARFVNPFACNDLHLIDRYIRAKNNLGLSRDAVALTWRMWRKKNLPDELIELYLHALRRQGNCWQGLKESKRFIKSIENPELLSKIYDYQSSILSLFRDFKGAEDALETAISISRSTSFDISRAYLALDSDAPDQALEIVTEVLQIEPGKRSALQLKAHLHHLNGDVTKACETLAPHLAEKSNSLIQSTYFAVKQAYYLLELEDYQQAHQTIDQVKSWVSNPPAYWTRWINQATADIFCAEQKYDAALEYLEQTNLYAKTVAERIKSAQPDSDSRDSTKRKLLDVPFIRQNFYTCAPASLTSVSCYWGIQVSQEQIIEEICYRGTHHVDERQWAIKQGWVVKEFDLKFESAKQLLDKNIPILLTTVDPSMGHLQVLVGYDESTGTYFVRDPSYPRLQELLIDSAETYYAASGPRCMIILPEQHESLIDDIKLPAEKLYDEYFSLKLALEENRRGDGFHAYRQLIKLDENHRITINGQKELAYYDQDYKNTELALNELLKRYPNDISLILEKAYNLINIGTPQEVLDYLTPFVKVPNCHYLLKNLYIDQLRSDGRNITAALKLSKSLLKYNSLNDRILATYADVLWEVDEHEEVCEIYRLASCLEDKHEQYARQYYFAARFVKQEQLALNFLEDRVQRFGKKSSEPGMSYYSAVKRSHGEEHALKVLDSTIEHHPKDGQLLLYAAQEYLQAGDTKKSEQLIEHAKPVANKIEYLQTKGYYYDLNNQSEKALDCFQEVINYQPLNKSAIDSIARILTQLGREDQAETAINNLLAKFPNNDNLLTQKYTLTPKSDIDQRQQLLQLLIDQHPTESWAYIEYSNVLMHQNKLEDALNIVKNITTIRPDIASGFTQAGKIDIQLGNLVSAKSWFEQAIKVSCDETDAYELLLQCTESQEQEKLCINHIKSELIAQNSTGDGILNYQEFATPHESREELEDFLNYACEQRPDLWQTWVAKSRHDKKFGQLEKSVNTLTQASKHHGLKPVINLELAKLYRLQGNLNDAETEVRKALVINSDWSSAINELSDLLALQEKANEATEILEKYLRVNPQEVTTHAYLAGLYWSQGKHQLAIQSLTRALELYPEYRWGWNELHAWNHSLDKQSDTASLIKSTREKHPNSATLALVEATICGVTTDALDVLKQFLEGHPNSLEVFTEYCYLYCDLQKPDTAKETLETSRWKDSSITEISTLRAYIEVERGYIDRGIDIMNAVVAVQPGLSSGWRYLIIWHSDHKRDTKAVKQCLDHFIKLNNTNAKELYFAAGKLNNTSPEDPLVANLVERCIRLDPFNPGYLELYVDQLLKTEGKSEKNSQTISQNNLQNHSQNYLQNNQSLINKLETVLEITAPIKDSVVHLIASLQTACIKKEEPEKLAAIWSDILSKKDILYYQLEKAWNCLDQNGRVLTATNTLEEKWKNGEKIAPIAGEFLTTGKAKNLTIKKLDQWILTMDWSGEFSDYILEGYLRHSISLEAPINKKVLLKYTQKIYDNTTNWGLVGYSYATQADWRHATDWLESYSSKNNVQAWHIYFYAIAKLQRGNWEYGIKAMHDAYQLPADAYRDEIVTWVTLDNLLNQQPVNLDEFNNLVIKELSSYGSYAHHLAQVLAKLENSTFEAESKHINPILRQCQRIYQNVVGQPSVNMARQKAKKHIKNKIASKHVVKILWQWRLSNLF